MPNAQKLKDAHFVGAWFHALCRWCSIVSPCKWAVSICCSWHFLMMQCHLQPWMWCDFHHCKICRDAWLADSCQSCASLQHSTRCWFFCACHVCLRISNVESQTDFWCTVFQRPGLIVWCSNTLVVKHKTQKECVMLSNSFWFVW